MILICHSKRLYTVGNHSLFTWARMSNMDGSWTDPWGIPVLRSMLAVFPLLNCVVRLLWPNYDFLVIIQRKKHMLQSRQDLWTSCCIHAMTMIAYLCMYWDKVSFYLYVLLFFWQVIYMAIAIFSPAQALESGLAHTITYKSI